MVVGHGHVSGSPAADRSVNAFTCVVVAFSTLGGLLFGYDLCIVTVALHFIEEHFQLGTAAKEAVVSVVFIGATAGCLLGGPMTDRWGRRPAIAMCSAAFTVSAVIMAAAPSYEVLLLGRLLVGFAIGGSAMSVSVYVAELSKPALRGTLVALNEVALCVGCLLAFCVGGLVSSWPDGWRYMLGLSGVPAAIQLVGVLTLLPESPRWLLRNGHAQQALKVVRRIYAPQLVAGEAALRQMASGTAHGGHSDDGGATATGDLDDVASAHVATRVGIIEALRRVWANPPQRAALVLSVGVAVTQNLTASNAILYFSTEIFREVGVESLAASLGIGFAKLVGVCVGMVLIPRVGRRQLLIGGTIVEAIAFVGLTADFFFLRAIPEAMSDVGVAMVLLFILAWNCSWAPLMFVVCSEMLPASIRGVGMGLALSAFFATSFITNQLLLSLFDVMGDGLTFLLLTATSLVALFIVVTYVPETKDKSLHEIEQLFRRRTRAARGDHTALGMASGSLELSAVLTTPAQVGLMATPTPSRTRTHSASSASGAVVGVRQPGVAGGYGPGPDRTP